jgi:hypothetical protein
MPATLLRVVCRVHAADQIGLIPDVRRRKNSVYFLVVQFKVRVALSEAIGDLFKYNVEKVRHSSSLQLICLKV